MMRFPRIKYANFEVCHSSKRRYIKSARAGLDTEIDEIDRAEAF